MVPKPLGPSSGDLTVRVLVACIRMLLDGELPLRLHMGLVEGLGISRKRANSLDKGK
jgi:hypothetical protein